MEHEERLKAALADRYQIEREIGSGGMATVYLAQDLKHDRKVAVKVMRPELTADMGADRFLAEIRTTATLSHPHILPLHDSGEADGFLFYVMPYVDGESLRERLDREGQLPVEEAVRIVCHVADALESAHRHGVIHRDLKPANILFQQGEPVIADFGIALAVSAAGEGRLTETGFSLGTPYYMSPEQASGERHLPHASDVYSMGCVLYEMLTGDPPHMGSSPQAILGKILLGEVTRPTQLRPTIPANVEGAALKALERLPADRFESAAELGAALKDKAFRHGAGVGAATAGPWKWLSISLGVSTLLALVALVTVALWPEPPPPVIRLPIHPPGRSIPAPSWARGFALAPDGSSMVYQDTVGLASGSQLWVKERGSAKGRPLSGTVNAFDVVYSPDGQWVAFKDGTRLMKAPIRGGGAIPVLDSVMSTWLGLDWTAGGTILCGLEQSYLVRIPEDAAASPDTVFVSSPEWLAWVHGLPGEEAALVVTCGDDRCTIGSVLKVVDFRADTPPKTLLDGVLRAWYTPTGQVVLARRDGSVWAARFDLGRLDFMDDPVPIFEGVHNQTYIANMVMAEDGTVVFVEGSAAPSGFEPVWVDREGHEETMGSGLLGDVRSPALSPDGKQLAVESRSGAGEDFQISIADLERGSMHRLTSEGGRWPTWSPHGGSVSFQSTRREGNYELWARRADGSGEAELLLAYDRGLGEAVWSPDSTWLIVQTGDERGGRDILAWQVGGDTVSVPLAATEFLENAPALSPDGRFLAYTSNESGVSQVYVVPFPRVLDGRKVVGSVGVGQEPVWGPDGRELFYRKGPGGALMAVEVLTTDPFRIGEEHALFPAGRYQAYSYPQYDVAPDGRRFVMLRPAQSGEAPSEPRMIMIQNFFTELEEKVGGRR